MISPCCAAHAGRTGHRNEHEPGADQSDRAPVGPPPIDFDRIPDCPRSARHAGRVSGRNDTRIRIDGGSATSALSQTGIAERNHRRALRFFWSFLIGATSVSLIGNIAHAVLSYLSRVVIQIGAAAVPPIALLAAVHGIALAVPGWSVGSGLPLGGHRDSTYRCWGIRGELSRPARPDAGRLDTAQAQRGSSQRSSTPPLQSAP
jgi:hypothetical protein